MYNRRLYCKARKLYQNLPPLRCTLYNIYFRLQEETITTRLNIFKIHSETLAIIPASLSLHGMVGSPKHSSFNVSI